MSLEKNSSTTVRSFVPLSDEEQEQVALLSAAGMPAFKIAEVLRKDKRLFLMDFKKVGTDVHTSYYLGLEQAKAETNQQMLAAAQKGNVTAKQIMEKIWEEQKLENMKNEIFNS